MLCFGLILITKSMEVLPAKTRESDLTNHYFKTKLTLCHNAATLHNPTASE